nr:hypothetical protein [Tanacetum cinerariifolium]
SQLIVGVFYLVDFLFDLLLTIIMANLPPSDHAADLPDDDPVNPEHALPIHHHAPAPPEEYIDDDDIKDNKKDPNEDPEEEPVEQVVPKQNNMDGFALHMNCRC